MRSAILTMSSVSPKASWMTTIPGTAVSSTADGTARWPAIRVGPSIITLTGGHHRM